MNDVVNIPYERQLVEAVDNILAVAKQNGSFDAFKTSKDWETLDYLFYLWQILYTDEYSRFLESIQYFRQYEQSSVAKEHGAMLQHKIELPQHLHQMIKVVWRQQRFTKPFIRGLIEHFPQFKPGEGTKN